MRCLISIGLISREVKYIVFRDMLQMTHDHGIVICLHIITQL